MKQSRLVTWWTGMSRTASAATAGGLALVCAAAGLFGYDTVALGSGALAGTPVNATTAQALSLAALSCPMLSGPRLAGQVMANSGFAPDAATSAGAGGVSGLSSAVFSSWAPWPKADARDQTADVYALAHYMCDLAGRLRQSGMDRDAWSLALAAYESGVPAVTKAAGVPAAAQDYVDRVGGYAAWYAAQDVFTGVAASPSAGVSIQGSAAPAAKTDALAQMPAAYASGVTAAGSICAAVTPARVAAELAAASGFDPNHRSDDGAMGIAGFDSDLWNQYAPAGASPWDPEQAVPALGKALCALVETFEPMGGDGYADALAAFRVGPTAVRQAGGVPAIPAVSAFVTQATGLVGADPSSAPSRSATTPSPTPTPSRTVSPSPKPSPSRTTATTTSPATPTTKPPITYKIVNGYSHKVLSTADTNAGSALVQEPDNGTAAEHFLLEADADGSVRIKNVADDLVLSPENGSTADFAFATQVADTSTKATRWTLISAGGSSLQIKNVGSGLLLALQFMVNDDGLRVFQHDDNGTADHLWQIVPVS